VNQGHCLAGPNFRISYYFKLNVCKASKVIE
jgi:hypothetical protein